MLCWQWYTCTKCLVVTITTFKMRGVAMRYYCDLWPVNSGVRTVTSYILLAGMEINNPHTLLASFQPIQLLAQEEGAWVTQGTRRLGTRLTNPQASWPGSQGQYCSCEKHIYTCIYIGHSHTVKPCFIRALVLAETHVVQQVVLTTLKLALFQEDVIDWLFMHEISQWKNYSKSQ